MLTSGGLEPVEGHAAVADVVVDVNETRSDVKAGNVDDFAGGSGGNLFGDSGDFAGGDGNVHDGVDVVGRIDDVPALQKEIVRRGLSRRRDGKERQKGDSEKNSKKMSHAKSFVLKRYKRFEESVLSCGAVVTCRVDFGWP